MPSSHDAQPQNKTVVMSQRDLRDQFGPWFRTHLDFIKTGMLGHVEAMFLCSVIDHDHYQHTKRDKNGYFLCTGKFLYDLLRWTHNQQAAYLKLLAEKGYIHTVMRGMPRRRWVFVDYANITTYLQKHRGADEDLDGSPVLCNSDDLRSEDQMTVLCNSDDLRSEDQMITTTRRIEPDEDITRLSRDKLATERSRQTPQHTPRKKTLLNGRAEDETNALTFAKQLYAHLAKERKLTRVVKNIKAWAREFHELLNVVEDDHVRDTLTWYLANLDGDYVPVAYSAKTFCAKFSQIQAAMRRNKKQDPPVRLYRITDTDNGDGTVTSRTLYKVVPKSRVEHYEHKGWRFANYPDDDS